MWVVYLMSGTQGEKDQNAYKEGQCIHGKNVILLLILIFLDLDLWGDISMHGFDV